VTEIDINAVKIAVVANEAMDIKKEDTLQEKAKLLIKHRGQEKVLNEESKSSEAADLIHISATSAAKEKQRNNLAKLSPDDSENQRLYKHKETINGYIYNL